MTLAQVCVAATWLTVVAACAGAPKLHDEERAAAGDPDAAHRLCFDYTYGERGLARDGFAARRWCGIGARLGNASAQTLYAQALETDFGGPRSMDSAVFWYRAAANQQHPHAQYVLGYLYLRGAVPIPSVSAAESLLRASSAQGYDAPELLLRQIDSARGAAGAP